MESSIDINQLTKEVLVSSDMHGEFWNVCVWDYTSGTNLQTFKNSNTIPHGLEFIRNDYMLCAAHNKPFITYWNLKGKYQANRINTSGFVTCIAVSNCSNYIVYAVEERAFVLQAHSGKLIGTLTKHLQNISCIGFTRNDRYVITAGVDSLVIVWDFYEILNSNEKDEFLKPVCKWNNHSMRINDLYVAKASDRIVTASSDQTCKFWSLTQNENANSSPVHNVLFQSIPNRCVLDNLESNLYVGLVNGTIMAIPVKTIFHETNKLIMNENTESKMFIGHKQKINCLSISLDDFTLASGSDDMNIRVWDTLSKQCLRIINQNASVTNLLFKHRTVFFNEDSSSTTSSTQTPALFSRYSSNAQANTDSINALSMKQSRQLVNLDDFLLDSVNEQSQDDEYFVLKCKYENMKRINEKMYNLAIERIFNE